MYEVYADGHLLYSDRIENLKIVSPKADLEVNKTGKFTFTIWPNHPYYNLIYKLKTIVTIWQDDYLMFRGRVLDDEFGFHNERKIVCEGHLAFLLDSFIRPYTYTGSIEGYLGMLLDAHNSQVDEDKQFVLGKVTVTDPNNTITRSNAEGAKTWNEINDKLIKLLGGYIRIRHEEGVYYLDYLEDFTVLSSQKVEFAKNLLDMKMIRKGSNIATVLVPYGAKLKDDEGNDTDVRLDITSVNDGLDYIYDEEAVEKYGWIVATYTWDDVTLASNLLTKAKEHLASLVENPDTLELSAADLATTDKTVTSFHLGTYVQVTSNPHGIDQKFLVSKLSIQLLNPMANKLTLGGVIESFTTQSMNKINSVTVAKGEKGDKGDDGKDAAVQSDTEPSDTSYMWLDTSTEPPILKRHNGTEWVVVNDNTEELQILEENLQASIQESSTSLLLTVSENYYLKDETDSLVQSVSTELEQTKDSFNMTFTQYSADLDALASGTDAEFEEIRKYIRFSDGKILLGEVGNELELQIANDRISFLQNGAEVAYFTDRKLYVTDGEYTNSLTLGQFAFIPRTNGNLSFKKMN